MESTELCYRALTMKVFFKAWEFNLSGKICPLTASDVEWNL